MKIKIIAILVLIGIVGTSFTTENVNEGYTYLLTVKSVKGTVETFDLKILSYSNTSREPKETILKAVQTPFEKNLGNGKHVITITSDKDDASIEGMVVGVLNGEKKGWASSKNERTKVIDLQAGPGGEYRAAQ
ncbi:hypothetical protein [Aquimarina sp. AU474]|uniref:hypothetical protein n=1 Tax=Aquimarina sp. AU474 TaxID=2108529 RepID=UPI000D68D4B6|nr:hypothetical protein [Aquimarina sp. AU474]